MADIPPNPALEEEPNYQGPLFALLREGLRLERQLRVQGPTPQSRITVGTSVIDIVHPDIIHCKVLPSLMKRVLCPHFWPNPESRPRTPTRFRMSIAFLALDLQSPDDCIGYRWQAARLCFL